VIGPPAFPEVVFGPAVVEDYAAYAGRDVAAAVRFGLGLLDRGFLVKPGTKIYQSAVHTEQEIDLLLTACAESLAPIAEGAA
jgi:glutamate-1-semialdehyde 2,1-aminomutase